MIPGRSGAPARRPVPLAMAARSSTEGSARLGGAVSRWAGLGWGPAAVGVAAVAACVVVRALDPTGAGPGCPFLAVTGRFCPGCGSTRALHHLTNADLGGALSYNPLTVLALPYLVWAWAAWASSTAGGPRLALLPQRRATSVVVAVVIVGFAVARNLPWFPFSALAPG